MSNFAKDISDEGGAAGVSLAEVRFSIHDDLWQAFCSGDERAFAVIYQSHAQDLFHFGLQLTKDRELCKDIIQDVFISLRCSNGKQKIKSIKSYLFKCFYTEWIRKSKRERRFTPLKDHYAVTSPFEDTLIRQQKGEAQAAFLQKALAQLTNKQRHAVMLFYYEGFSYEQLAEAIGVKGAKSARKLIYRALARLKPKT